MKNLSIFEPQIEKHHAYKKKHVVMSAQVQLLYIEPHLQVRFQGLTKSRFLIENSVYILYHIPMPISIKRVLLDSDMPGKQQSISCFIT